MKVLMILSRCDQTGMTTHALDLSTALLKKGVDVTVLIGYEDKTADDIEKKLFERFKSAGCKLITFKKPARISKISKIISSLSLLKNIKSKYNIIHVQSPYLSWAPWILRRKFVSTMHVTDIYPSHYYKNATHLIAISQETKKFAKELHHYKEEEITIVHHGVSSSFAPLISEEEKDRIKEELNLPKDKLLISIVGSIEPRKGHDLLLKAVEQLKPELKERIHIVILGGDKNKDGKNIKWLNQSIENTKTQGIVTHFDYQNPENYYKISDIFVLPSWQEGFGLVVVEAMLSNCLCIRTDTEGAFEQIKNEETGFIFPKGDWEKLSQILEKMILDENKRKEIAYKGRKYALSHFQSDVMAENTIKVYKKLLSKP